MFSILSEYMSTWVQVKSYVLSK